MGVEYHLLGVGGIGMSALARILLDQKRKISGHDAKRSALVTALEGEGVKFTEEVAGTVVVSTAIADNHPQVRAAKKVLHRSELLRELMKPFKTLAVTGTHGKTTTSSLLAWVLLEGGLDPAFALGGIIPSLNRNGRHGKGEYFVAEADESDGSFLKCDPFGAIITGVEADHLDYWKTPAAIEQAFDQFAEQVESDRLLFWSGDDPYLASTMVRGISYGFGSGCTLQATDVKQEGFSLSFTASFEGSTYPLTLPLIGRHNVLNALAVFGMAMRLGIRAAKIQAALATFPGIQRRCQVREVARGVTVIDDYAHHPTEVKTTLEGVRAAIKERRLVALFQPHRYSRLEACWEGFLSAFSAADEVWVTDLHSAGEEMHEGISAEAFAKELRATYVPQNELIQKANTLGPTDVLVGMGAGTITGDMDSIVKTLTAHPVKKRIIGVVCGGPSFEHEISVTSGRAIADAISRERYDVRLFILDRSNENLSLSKLQQCDLLIPAFHGPQGEDGQFAGLCEVLGLPYVGCDPLSAALAMHKPQTKRLVQSEGIPTAPYMSLSKAEWEQNPDVSPALTYPLFVKTARSGSSLGVYKVECENDLRSALEAAFALDTNLLIEQGIVGREIEFAVLGNDYVEVPPPGELLTYGRMYTYEAKYEEPFETNPQADLSPALIEEGRALAKQVYRTLGCCGLARVDFFLDEEERWWFNEANPFPGFTPISLFPKVWAANGVPFPALLERLINLGLAKSRQNKRLQAQWTAP